MFYDARLHGFKLIGPSNSGTNYFYENKKNEILIIHCTFYFASLHENNSMLTLLTWLPPR